MNLGRLPGRSPHGRFISIAALVLWTMLLAIGAAGFALPYPLPRLPNKSEPPVVAENLQVELTDTPVPALSEAPPASPVPPPLVIPASAPLEAPPLTPVAEPSAVAFALPVEGPAEVVAPEAAAFAAPAAEPVITRPAPPQPPQQLTYGQGEGRQPAPEYPYRAKREGQEGVVKVRFTVGENGQVLSAESAGSSPWPMLNDAAVRVVRDRWQFRPGLPRHYEVSIRFQLTR